MNSETFLYFAYGSNLLRERLMYQNKSAIFVSVGRLDDYAFHYSGTSEKWFGGVGSVFEKPGTYVMGAVWQLDISDMVHLDEQENTYNPVEVDVVTTDDRVLKCRTYERTHTESKPSPQYLNIVLTGARQSGLPENYAKFLGSFGDNGYKKDIPMYHEIMAEVKKNAPKRGGENGFIA